MKLYNIITLASIFIFQPIITIIGFNDNTNYNQHYSYSNNTIHTKLQLIENGNNDIYKNIINNRLEIILDNNKNSIIIDADTVLKRVKLLKLDPFYELDFRDYTSLFLKVEKDANIESDETISSFILTKQRKKYNVALINKEYENFEQLEISIYDQNKESPIEFKVRVTLYLTPEM